MAEPDFTEQFNTPLAPDAEAQYQQWLAQQSQLAGRDMRGDLWNYDMRGAFQFGAGASGENQHWPDTWKKPNHPSFSDQSRYHGVEGHQGGAWSQDAGGQWSFRPGPTNLEMHGPDGLQNYFQRGDPGVRLELPTEAPEAAPMSMLDYVRASMARPT